MQITESRLHVVLKVKEHQEKKAHRELIQIRGTRENETAILDRLNEKEKSVVSDAIRTLRARATEMQTSRAFLQSLSRHIQQQKRKVDEMHSLENKKREELLEKSQAKQMIKKLQEKRETEAAREHERKEQRLIDILTQRLHTVP